jgi:hypothetical protein
MFNFYYAPDAPDCRVLKGQVHQAFDLIKAGQFEPDTSAYTTDELEAETNVERREQMKGLIIDYGIRFLGQSDEAERLAVLCVQEEAVPAVYPTDAAHIAITAVNGLDFIVSLNFGYIARPWTIERVRR